MNCYYDVVSNKFEFSRKGLCKQVLEQSSDGPLDKYHRVLGGKFSFLSTNRGFRTKNHTVATYKPVKKALPNF